MPLPPGWSSGLDPGSGRTYYWQNSDPANTKTWELPAGATGVAAEEAPAEVRKKKKDKQKENDAATDAGWGGMLGGLYGDAAPQDTPTAQEAYPEPH